MGGLLASILGLIENAPGELQTATTIIEGVETTVASLATNPAVAGLFAWIESRSTATSTPGQAVVVEPITLGKTK